MQQSDALNKDDSSLKEYVVVLLSRWWIILAVLVVIMLIAGTTSPPKPPDMFEASTNISILRYLSDSGPLDQGRSVSLSLNQDLARSDATLSKVIQAADLRNAETGAAWSVGRLDGLLSVKPAEADNAQEVILTVRNQDPAQAKRILEEWAGIFAEESTLILEKGVIRTRAQNDQSRDLKSSQYEDARKGLAAEEESRLSFLQLNHLSSLEAGLQLSLSQFNVLGQELSSSRTELATAGPQLESIRDALAIEPPHSDLDQEIEYGSLLAILAEEMTILEPYEPAAEITNIFVNGVRDDAQLFFRFKQLEVELLVRQAALTAGVVFLESEIAKIETDIGVQSNQIETIKLKTKRMDREIDLLEENFNRLGREFQVSKLALPEISGPFLEIAPVDKPRVPISSANPLIRRLMIGGILGLVSGVALAFAVHFVQEMRRRQSPA